MFIIFLLYQTLAKGKTFYDFKSMQKSNITVEALIVDKTIRRNSKWANCFDVDVSYKINEVPYAKTIPVSEFLYGSLIKNQAYPLLYVEDNPMIANFADNEHPLNQLMFYVIVDGIVFVLGIMYYFLPKE